MTEVVGCKCGCAETSSEWDKDYGQFYSYIECDKCNYYWEGYTVFELKMPSNNKGVEDMGSCENFKTTGECKVTRDDCIHLGDTDEDIGEFCIFEKINIDKNARTLFTMEKEYKQDLRIENLVHYHRLEELENPREKLDEVIRFSIALDNINKHYTDRLKDLGYTVDNKEQPGKSVNGPVLELNIINE